MKMTPETKKTCEIITALPKCIHTKDVPRDTISEHTDYKRSSRDTYIQRLSVRKLIVISGAGLVRASNHLFD